MDESKDADNNANVLGEMFVKLGEIVRAEAEESQIDTVLTTNNERVHEIMIKAEPIFLAESTITIKVMWKNLKNKKSQYVISSKIEPVICKV